MRQFDVVIVGARVAGSALALKLREQGRTVLVVDKASGPTDVVSTHFVNPRGLTYLKTLGVLDDVLAVTPAFEYFDVHSDDFDLGGRLREKDLSERLERAHPGERFALETRYACIRRPVLDGALQAAAAKAGAILELGTEIEALVSADGGVRGIVVSRDGHREEIRAGLVVGADGRRSRVAQLLDVPKIEERTACTFACYSYFSGLSLPNAQMKKRDRLSYAAAPTSGGLTMVLVFGPAEYYEAFRADKERNFLRALEAIDPAFAATFAASAKREESFRATDDQPGFFRAPSPLGVPLVGDAGCSKDQCTASGITHALRDAFLLASELGNERAGRKPRALALRDFEGRRYQDGFRFYEFTSSQAEMNPLRADEEELYEIVSALPEEREKFIGLYFDTVSVRDFFKASRIEALMKRLRRTERRRIPKRLETVYANPFGETAPELPLMQTCADYSAVFGKNLIDRAEPYHEFFRRREQANAFQYSRTLHCFPGTTTRLSDLSGRVIDGVNFASQDYLGLGQSPEIRAAADEALQRFGPHSAGSPMIIGNTLISQALEEELKRLTGKKHVLLFPTGYAAGMGSILGIVKPHDHIVMDRLSHASLQQGARAATRNVYRHAHLSVEAARAQLADIRKRDVRNGILLVTEGLFSMDADSPDLRAFQEIAHEYDATLFVDVAHDLGAMGPHGTGQAGAQGMYGKLDLLMGSFSKSFATNGGFLATDSEALLNYLKMFSTAHLFSNALSPIQAGVALEAARIMQSDAGDALRASLMRAVHALRDELGANGMECLGAPSPIVPVMIGTERDARLCHKGMTEKNVAAMIIEYPVVPIGMARYRLQVMATHTEDQARAAARTIADVTHGVREGRATRSSASDRTRTLRTEAPRTRIPERAAF